MMEGLLQKHPELPFLLLAVPVAPGFPHRLSCLLPIFKISHKFLDLLTTLQYIFVYIARFCFFAHKLKNRIKSLSTVVGQGIMYAVCQLHLYAETLRKTSLAGAAGLCSFAGADTAPPERHLPQAACSKAVPELVSQGPAVCCQQRSCGQDFYLGWYGDTLVPQVRTCLGSSSAVPPHP